MLLDQRQTAVAPRPPQVEGRVNVDLVFINKAQPSRRLQAMSPTPLSPRDSSIGTWVRRPPPTKSLNTGNAARRQSISGRHSSRHGGRSCAIALHHRSFRRRWFQHNANAQQARQGADVFPNPLRPSSLHTGVHAGSPGQVIAVPMVVFQLDDVRKGKLLVDTDITCRCATGKSFMQRITMRCASSRQE